MQFECPDADKRKIGIIGKPNFIFADHVYGVAVIDERQAEWFSKFEVLENHASRRIETDRSLIPDSSTVNSFIKVAYPNLTARSR